MTIYFSALKKKIKNGNDYSVNAMQGLRLKHLWKFLVALDNSTMNFRTMSLHCPINNPTNQSKTIISVDNFFSTEVVSNIYTNTHFSNENKHPLCKVFLGMDIIWREHTLNFFKVKPVPRASELNANTNYWIYVYLYFPSQPSAIMAPKMGVK